MRVYIEHGTAFVYDPIFLEGPSKTLIVDWGSKLVNENTGRYIFKNGEKSSVFHTFVFPVHKVRKAPSIDYFDYSTLDGRTNGFMLEHRHGVLQKSSRHGHYCPRRCATDSTAFERNLI
jgi:hypothetical protein